MSENWKDIEGYEGLYQVSDKGRVRSLPRTVVFDRNGSKIVKIYKGCVLKQELKKNGYMSVGLHNCGKVVKKNVHRLVAMAFCDGYEKGLQINHKDENKTNNVPSNLEWCTAAYNNAYGTHPRKVAEKNKRRVCQYSLGGVFIAEHESLKSAYIRMGVPINSGAIARCCTGKQKTAYGFMWAHKKRLSE